MGLPRVLFYISACLSFNLYASTAYKLIYGFRNGSVVAKFPNGDKTVARPITEYEGDEIAALARQDDDLFILTDPPAEHGIHIVYQCKFDYNSMTLKKPQEKNGTCPRFYTGEQDCKYASSMAATKGYLYIGYKEGCIRRCPINSTKEKCTTYKKAGEEVLGLDYDNTNGRLLVSVSHTGILDCTTNLKSCEDEYPWKTAALMNLKIFYGAVWVNEKSKVQKSKLMHPNRPENLREYTKPGILGGIGYYKKLPSNSLIYSITKDPTDPAEVNVLEFTKGANYRCDDDECEKIPSDVDGTETSVLLVE